MGGPWGLGYRRLGRDRWVIKLKTLKFIYGIEWSIKKTPPPPKKKCDVIRVHATSVEVYMYSARR